ncbi:MAG: HDOD domain-containing protein [Proteobacteria bacterium]|nr:HDOD domain-containing protein [Pseudomonadota bacterium]MBU1688238.1 HDOD domain-containing protein [Pseudomonadota bacterium]
MFNAETIAKKYSDLKTLPHVAIRVNQMVHSGNVTMQDFEEVIRLDPVLVSRLLKLVNSPYFGLVNRVDSIAKAVVFIGMKNLRNLVAVEALRDVFKEGDPAEGFSRKNLWMHSATVAILAEMIATRIFGISGEDCFLAGIIHDIGLVAEDQVAGEQLRAACRLFNAQERSIVEFERESIGTDHCRVGSILARQWNLPEDIQKAIRFHHDRSRDVVPESPIGILQMAEYFAGKVNYAVVTNQVEPLAPSLVKHLKMKLDNYKVIIRDLPSEISKAKELYISDG